MKREELKIGDRVILTKIPKSDLDEREKQKQSWQEDVFCMANVLEHIIEQYPIVTIEDIDEYGNPWFSSEIQVNGEIQNHTLALMDDVSWEKIWDMKKFDNPEQQALSDQIEAVLEKYFKEYNELADESEKLYDARQKLEEKYRQLDKKTGLNKLYEEFEKFYTE